MLKVSPNGEGAKILRIRAHLYIEPAAMTGRNTSHTTAAGVVDIIRQVWNLVVIVVAVHSVSRIFGGTLR